MARTAEATRIEIKTTPETERLREMVDAYHVETAAWRLRRSSDIEETLLRHGEWTACLEMIARTRKDAEASLSRVTL